MLIKSISGIPEVCAIGKSGGEQLPENGESDIDVFVFCETIPSVRARKAAVDALNDIITSCDLSERAGKHWGVCDFVNMRGAEICCMYFTRDQMDGELHSVLTGERLNKEDNYFYPTGRCATFLSMYILCDPHEYIAATKKRLAHYPDELAGQLVEYHLDMLNDMEDIERAVARKDPLFYHFALDLSLDHLLQALFAMNKRYFPSRKRSVEYIGAFEKKPADCEARLLRLISLGGNAESVEQSYEILLSLSHEMNNLWRR